MRSTRVDDEGEHHMAIAASGEPECVAIAGDWHGNTAWAGHVIRLAGEMLAGERVRLLVQLGDFGFWGNVPGRRYLRKIESDARAAGLRIMALRGNHEDPAVVEEYSVARARPDWALCSLPDGIRWTWHERAWAVAGGAVSPDRAHRVPGVSWWPEEELSGEDAQRIIDAGHADVLISHDAGSGVNLRLPPWPDDWHMLDLLRSTAHRERLQRVADALQPRYWMHGHYHLLDAREYDFGYGPVQVTSFDRDGELGNWALLNVRTMEWGDSP